MKSVLIGGIVLLVFIIFAGKDLSAFYKKFTSPSNSIVIGHNQAAQVYSDMTVAHADK